MFEEYVHKRDAAASKQQKVYYQKKVEATYDKLYSEGYYRDSYNNSNLLWRLGLDYWVWFAGHLDDEGKLSPDNAAKILSDVEHRKHLLDEIDDKDEREYFHEKYDQFLNFLRTAIELDESVACSI